MRWALYLPVKLPHAVARVLWYLAERAEDDGREVFPAVDTIARVIQGDRKTVQRALRMLVKLEVLLPERASRGGRARTNQYRINLLAGQPKAKARPDTPDLFPETVAPCPGLAPDPIATKTGQNRGAMPPLRRKTGEPCPINRGTIPPDSVMTPSITTNLSPVGRDSPPLRVVAGTAIDPQPTPKADPRGSRLPPDWQPSPELCEFAASLRLDPAHIAANFRDYWHAKPGAGGRKANWPATWRMWCRKEAERTVAHARQGPPTKLSQNEIMRRAIYGDGDDGHSGPTIDGEAYAAQPYGAIR